MRSDGTSSGAAWPIFPRSSLKATTSDGKSGAAALVGFLLPLPWGIPAPWPPRRPLAAMQTQSLLRRTWEVRKNSDGAREESLKEGKNLGDFIDVCGEVEARAAVLYSRAGPNAEMWPAPSRRRIAGMGLHAIADEVTRKRATENRWER